jgi:hypothetical protein
VVSIKEQLADLLSRSQILEHQSQAELFQSSHSSAFQILFGLSIVQSQQIHNIFSKIFCLGKLK